MWPNWVFISMAMLSAFLFGVLCYPMAKELNAVVARKWQTWKTHRDHVAWVERRQRFAREALR